MPDKKEDSNQKNKGKKKTRPSETSSGNRSWIVKILLMSIAISAVFSLLSSQILQDAGYAVAFIVLAVFILLGIVFDIIGVSVTVADERPFHSMAAHREPGASAAIHLIRNANRVSTICNDVVGDISGIVSGTTAAVVVSRLTESFDISAVVAATLVPALVSGLTIGGKAIGKTFAMSRSTDIVLAVSKIYRFIYKG